MISEIKKQLFKNACETALAISEEKNGIGTLNEKTLHAVLKYYFEPYAHGHEIKIGNYYADIVGENGIIEIQTGNFGKLKKKLENFLKACNVTVVYPIPYRKRIFWIDTKTGEKTGGKFSPKRGTPYEVFPELNGIKEFLTQPNLTICILMINIEEQKYLDGYGKNKKNRASRCDRIPVELEDEIYIYNIRDYMKFIPDNLSENFTSEEFCKSAGIYINSARYALYVLNAINVVSRIGKKGNSYIYNTSIL